MWEAVFPVWPSRTIPFLVLLFFPCRFPDWKTVFSLKTTAEEQQQQSSMFGVIIVDYFKDPLVSLLN